MGMTRLSFTYQERMKNKLKFLAEKENRTLSSYVQKILADHLDKKFKKKLKTKKTKK